MRPLLLLVFVLYVIGVSVCEMSTDMVSTESMITTMPMSTTEAKTIPATTEAKTTPENPTTFTTGTTPSPTTGTTPLTVTTGNPLTTHRGTESPIGPPTGTWTVKDNEGGVCMKMQFGARLYIGFQNTSNDYDLAVVDVPTTAVAESSECVDKGPRHFILHLFTETEYTEYWYLNFTYDVKTKYSLTEVGIAVTYEEVHFKNPKEKDSRSYEYTTNINFLNSSVPVGKSFTCSKGLAFQTTSMYIYMTDLILQPFADKAQGNFGQSMECSTPSSTNKGLIIGVSVGASILVVVVLVVVVFVVMRSRKTQAEDLRPLGVQ